MAYYDSEDNANALVEKWIRGEYAKMFPDNHLNTCPDVVVSYDGGDGVWGCETGCSYVRMEATLKCPHEEGTYGYGEFGDMADILEELEM